MVLFLDNWRQNAISDFRGRAVWEQGGMGEKGGLEALERPIPLRGSEVKVLIVNDFE